MSWKSIIVGARLSRRPHGRVSIRLALAIRRAASLPFWCISSDRQVRSQTGESCRTRGTWTTGSQSRMGRGWSVPTLLLLCSLDMAARKPCSCFASDRAGALQCSQSPVDAVMGRRWNHLGTTIHACSARFDGVICYLRQICLRLRQHSACLPPLSLRCVAPSRGGRYEARDLTGRCLCCCFRL